jgi:hypothetical protein
MMPRDKNVLPVDVLYDFLLTATSNHGYLYHNLRSALSKRFKLSDDAQVNKKYAQLKDDFDKDPDKYYQQLIRSPRVTLKWILTKKLRFSTEVEKLFLENNKDSHVYFTYCEIFNIIVENYAQIVTEVALECKDSHRKKSYLNNLTKRRKLCKEWIGQFLQYKTEISENDSIKTLLENL